MKHKTSLFLLLFIILLWGLSWPINKIGLSYTSPTNYIELRFAAGALAMFFVALVSKNVIIPNVRDLPIIITVGIFQLGLMMNLSNYGLSIVGAGKATFLVYTMSIWNIPLSALLHKKLSFYDTLSFVVGMVGVVFLVEPWSMSGYKDPRWLGDGALLLSAFSWSIGILCARYLKWHRPPLQLLPWQILLGAVGTIIFASFQGVTIIPDKANPVLWGTLVYTGMISIAIGYWAMIVVSKNLSPAITSMGVLFVPIISLAFSWLFLKEEATYNLIIAVLCITAGALIKILHEKKPKPTGML